MNLKSTTQNFWAVCAFLSLFLAGVNLNAQVCQNERVIWVETFGQGSTTSSPDVINLLYKPDGDFLNEGIYRITNNVQQIADWHNSGDHTGDADGRMLVINGEAFDFYQKIIPAPGASGFTNATYNVSFYAMNANGVMVCGPSMLLAQLKATVEYLDAANNWVPLSNAPVTFAPLQHSDNPDWVKLQGSFDLSLSGTFRPVQMRLTISDLMHGGCGNDFAVDDIQLSQCAAEGGPTPVTFLGVTAQQKGNGVAVDWSTSQEINNERFEVERSGNGNAGWQVISTVAGAGTTNEVRNYSIFDGSPLTGTNYYRIRQIDIDGKADYSKTVNVRIDNGNDRVSVAGNPFVNSFTIKFNGKAQEVHARLVDITGKQVARETWNISGGETSRQFANISGLQKGIYILTIQNRNGDVLFNGKVFKQ